MTKFVDDTRLWVAGLTETEFRALVLVVFQKLQKDLDTALSDDRGTSK